MECVNGKYNFCVLNLVVHIVTALFEKASKHLTLLLSKHFRCFLHFKPQNSSKLNAVSVNRLAEESVNRSGNQ